MAKNVAIFLICFKIFLIKRLTRGGKFVIIKRTINGDCERIEGF